MGLLTTGGGDCGIPNTPSVLQLDVINIHPNHRDYLMHVLSLS